MSVMLIFGSFTSPWQPPPSTTPENKPLCSFFGGDLSLVTTTTHHFPKMRCCSFLGGSPLPGNHHHPQPPKTSMSAHFRVCFWCSPSPPSLKQQKHSILSKFCCLITFLYLISPYNPILFHSIPPLLPLFSLSPLFLSTPSLAPFLFFLPL